MRLRSTSMPKLTGFLPGLLLALALVAGCSSAHYRRSADNEAYKIIQNVDHQVFGHTNAFSINTRYSGRDLKTIPPAEIIEDRSATNRRVLNLEQALDLAVTNSRDYQAQKELLYLTALTLTGARYQFGPQFFGSSTPQVSGTAGGDAAGTVNNQLGVNQALASGGKLTVTLANDLLHYFTAGLTSYGTRNTAINTMSVNFTQPLMRGFGFNNPAWEALTQADRDVIYAVRTFSRYQQQFAVDTVTAYFNLLTQKDIVRNNFRNFTNRVETTQYLEARSVDRERSSSVDDARTAELGAKRDYINSLAGFLSALDAFKLRLGLPLSEQLYLEDRDLKELIDTGILSVDIDRNAAFGMCVQGQMEILNAIDKFEDSKRKARIAADQLRADVNFLAGSSLSSDAPYDYTRFNMNNVNYNVGLNVNLPLDRLQERNNYRKALVDFEAQLRSLGLTLDNYKARIDSGLRTAEQNRMNYINGLEQLKVAQRRVENNVMLLEAGRATIRDVREAQDGLIQAQNNLATIYTDYLTARLGLLLDVGIIDTQPRKFWLLDPLTRKLNPGQRSPPPLRMPDNTVLSPETFLEPAS